MKVTPLATLNMHEITAFKIKNGQIFEHRADALKVEAALKGLDFECPACNATGHSGQTPIYIQVLDEEATRSESRPVYRSLLKRHEPILCAVCRGTGYTATEKKPIYTEPTIKGYE